MYGYCDYSLLLVIDCGTFNVPNGYKVVSCSRHKYGDVCDLSCASGYVGDVIDPVCGTSGWSEPSGCSSMRDDVWTVS